MYKAFASAAMIGMASAIDIEKRGRYEYAPAAMTPSSELDLSHYYESPKHQNRRGGNKKSHSKSSKKDRRSNRDKKCHGGHCH